MKSGKENINSHVPPFTDGKAAEPHYDDLIPCDAVECAACRAEETDKSRDLDCHRSNGMGMGLTTSGGVRIADNQNTLRAGSRGPALLEDFHFQEKLAHFDRERIPERVVHARGSGAHGYFQVYKSLAQYTKAAFLQDPAVKTPVFVRFSTVQGFRGSPDTVRDIRGWATKFYTSEGNFDLVGNNTGVFFIQDAIKFPDLVHAVKPEPQSEVPQGQSAHDSFWDFISLQPETLHNVMWAMSDRGIPRSYRTMEGFGIHTFRLVNAEGKSCFVRFHWKPVYGKSSLLWDESQLITGRDPDFHRKDLWDAIENGYYPEYELGLQIIPEEDELKFDFDILDPTKIIPEALVPVQLVGKMVLDRNPDNFFAETEQVAFCPANIVPGVDFSDDPLLQGRVFSYVDTQRHRLGGANFNEIPVNRPVCPVTNHQRDGMYRMQIDSGANYEPNTLSGNWPRETPPAPKAGGFHSFPSRTGAGKVRERSPSFLEYYAHPRLFWLSQTDPEKEHMIAAFSFELAKLRRAYIRERVLDHLARIDQELAKAVAKNMGLSLSPEQLAYPEPKPVCGLNSDPSLSLYARNEIILRGRKVSILAADGVSQKSLDAILKALKDEGITPLILAPAAGTIKSDTNVEIPVSDTLHGTPSALVDAVIVPDGEESVKALLASGPAKYQLCQAYKYLKPIGLHGNARLLMEAANLPDDETDPGLCQSDSSSALVEAFFKALKSHRIWSRAPKTSSIPA